MSSRCLCKTSLRPLEDVLVDEKLLRWRPVEDVLKMSWRPTNVGWGSCAMVGGRVGRKGVRGGGVHSTWWKYSTSRKFSLHSVYISRTGWNICAWTNYNYSLLRIIYILLDMIWIRNLHWGYILINEVGQWFYELDHGTFSKSVFWSVNCTLPFYQIYYIQMSTL